MLKLKEQKSRLIDDMNRKKNVEKLSDSGTIDRLLREYYDSIKEVMSDDSVERINKNTKKMLSMVGQSKNGSTKGNAF